MTSRTISQLVNGFIAIMLLSACAGAGQDQKQSAIVAAKPVVKKHTSVEPVLPRLKPKTSRKAPASPILSEPNAAVPIEGAMVDGIVIPPAAPNVIRAEPEPVAAASPNELKSKSEAEVIKLLGPPLTTRGEGTGTVWTYHAEICSLDVYFFLDVADNQRRALSYEVLPAWAEVDGGENCYKALKNAYYVQ